MNVGGGQRLFPLPGDQKDMWVRITKMAPGGFLIGVFGMFSPLPPPSSWVILDQPSLLGEWWSSTSIITLCEVGKCSSVCTRIGRWLGWRFVVLSNF